MADRKTHCPHTLTLFWKLYLYSLGLLLTVAITAGLATHLARNFEETPNLNSVHKALALLLSAHLDQDSPKPVTLQQMLDDLNKTTHITYSIFDAQDRLVAQSGDLPQKPLSQTKKHIILKHPFFWDDGQANFMIPLDDESGSSGYVMLSWKGPSVLRLALVILAVGLMLTVLPFLFARAISKPLSQISATARSIGEGQLSARTCVTRSDEIGVLAGEVDRMAGRIEHLIRAEKALIANISHEIRTPLSRIRVVLELLEETKDVPAAINDHLKGLNADVTELERLLEDVFFTARLNLDAEKASSSLILHHESIHLTEYVLSVVSNYRDKVTDHLFSVDVDPQLPILSADAGMLRRVLTNLLDNAVKYSDPGSQVDVTAFVQDQMIVLEVSDRGMGVAPNDLDHIFEPFYRTRHAKTATQHGIGMGLALCRRIVEEHGGNISARLRHGGGLVIQIRLGI